MPLHGTSCDAVPYSGSTGRFRATKPALKHALKCSLDNVSFGGYCLGSILTWGRKEKSWPQSPEPLTVSQRWHFYLYSQSIHLENVWWLLPGCWQLIDCVGRNNFHYALSSSLQCSFDVRMYYAPRQNANFSLLFLKIYMAIRFSRGK